VEHTTSVPSEKPWSPSLKMCISNPMPFLSRASAYLSELIIGTQPSFDAAKIKVGGVFEVTYLSTDSTGFARIGLVESRIQG